MAGTPGDRDAPGESRVKVRLELDVLDEAARARVEQVLQQALEAELANVPQPEFWRRPILIGLIADVNTS